MPATNLYRVMRGVVSPLDPTTKRRIGLVISTSLCASHFLVVPCTTWHIRTGRAVPPGCVLASPHTIGGFAESGLLDGDMLDARAAFVTTQASQWVRDAREIGRIDPERSIRFVRALQAALAAQPIEEVA